ncbi:MAG: aminopeptidase P family protein [Alphaproteobacteria bacterium]|nr:aminopeptidase P family protein [Alphaproteobacteria bacterium]
MNLRAGKSRVDDGLAAKLAKAGVRLSATATHDLVRGIAAAAPTRDDATWLALISPRRHAALDKSLLALKKHYDRAPDGIGARNASASRLAALRAELARRKLDGFLVPLADEYQGEYIARRAQRLAWLTGFTGSAGLAIVLAERAAIFVDGRYTLQAETQVDGTLYERHHITDSPPQRWLETALKTGQRLGYDPWLHTEDGRARLSAACESVGATLVATETSPIDAVWRDQPPPPLGPIVPHGIEFAGRSADDKRAEVIETIRTAKADACVLSAPDSIAWLLNIRGHDVANTPLPHSFALVDSDDRMTLFVDRRKLTPGLAEHLGNRVTVAAPDALGPALDQLGRTRRIVLYDASGSPAWLHDRLTRAGAKVVRGADPCLRPRARKNLIELAGTRAAHERDGAALVRFLAWLESALKAGPVDELGAVARLLSERGKSPRFMGPSFDTIAGAGPNGAIVHYRSTEASNRRLEPGSLFLLDSGGQYLDGTTDVTRTIAIGRPTPEQRDRFTRVLQGHIALGSARFPTGTTGSQLDALARQFLWQAGLDYDHGTGHGVGSYLAVHEGPHRISKVGNTVALEPGMIVSNEPGYYKTGAFGIRIENLVVVAGIEAPHGAERAMFGFETLTLVPIDRRLVEPRLMSAPELDWLDAYHAAVRERLIPHLKGTPKALAFLRRATRLIAR